MVSSGSSLEPQTIDFDAEWIELRKDLDLTFEAQVSRDNYTKQFSRIYKICVAQPEPKSNELYLKLSDFLEEKAQEIAQRLDSFENELLLEEYEKKWLRYISLKRFLFIWVLQNVPINTLEVGTYLWTKQQP